MTDQTKCPHCGDTGDKFGSGILFDCGSVVGHQSDLCELRSLRAKVVAQQELLKDASKALRAWRDFFNSEMGRRGYNLLTKWYYHAAEVLAKLEEVK